MRTLFIILLALAWPLMAAGHGAKIHRTGVGTLNWQTWTVAIKTRRNGECDVMVWQDAQLVLDETHVDHYEIVGGFNLVWNLDRHQWDLDVDDLREIDE